MKKILRRGIYTAYIEFCRYSQFDLKSCGFAVYIYQNENYVASIKRCCRVCQFIELDAVIKTLETVPKRSSITIILPENTKKGLIDVLRCNKKAKGNMKEMISFFYASGKKNVKIKKANEITRGKEFIKSIVEDFCYHSVVANPNLFAKHSKSEGVLEIEVL